MAVSYEEYYRDYLGVQQGADTKHSRVFYSKYREQPIHKKYVYPIIITDYKGVVICSASQAFLEPCQSFFDGGLESVPDLLENLGSGFYRRDMKRYAYETDDEPFKVLPSVAVTATKGVLESLSFEEAFDVDKYVHNNKITMEQGRQFIVLENNTVAARGIVSDLYGKGGNIVVYTVPEYRQKGYGKEVVKACINWCMMHQVLPIYFVEKENIHSIQLAESLGFTYKNDEIFIQKR